MSDEFWNFSLAVYQQPGVSQECIVLQDRLGLDVNLLLLSAYLGASRKVVLTADDIQSVIAASNDWHVEVVRNLRAARRALKAWEEGRDANVQESARALRSVVKKAELESEHIEHSLLASWAETRKLTPADPEIAVPQNMRTLLAHYHPDFRDADLPHHLIAAALSLR